MDHMAGDTLDIDGRTIAVTNLAKVLYPPVPPDDVGTRKFEVIDYYNRIAEVLLPHVRGRIITRKRWPGGVGSAAFFEKHLPEGAPAWLPRYTVEHSQRSITYAMADDRAALVWLAQMAALELHVPQWRVPVAGEPITATRLVLDLDPGPGVPLHECAQVALLIRQMLDAAGLASYPVTSGGKGIHVYARLDRPVSPDAARTVAKQIATGLASAHPDTITASMAKNVREHRVFIDWSQNSGSKTTLAPYSLRGRERPWVAAPRTWSELSEPDLRQLLYTEVLERVDESGDLLAGLDDPLSSHEVSRLVADAPHTSTGEGEIGERGTGEVNSSPTSVEDNTPPPPVEVRGTSLETSRAESVADLSEYRSKRDETKTPEPFGDDTHRRTAREGPIFVIQEHHARRLHYDFRLEHEGVLVSWAVPKNLPTDHDQNRLAVRTEDHPLDYAEFSGDIPAGEYGGGHVEIWDSGTYELEKWRDSEIIVRLRGRRIQGRYVLIKTGETNWLAHLMHDEPRPIKADLRDPRPMLAVDEPIDGLDGRDWAFEGKWDGYRVLVRSVGGEFRLSSRSGLDLTADFPELSGITGELGLLDVVLDGEVVAIDSSGRTNFTILASRSTTAEPYRLRLLLFDILYLNGKQLLDLPWSQRRQLLEELAPLFRSSPYTEVPALLDGSGADAVAHSREHNYEGVVAKLRTSVYQQGRRSTQWRKHKNWNDIEVVIGGWRPGRGNRADTIGSLLLGLPEETGLRYVGRVGTGFTDAQLRALADELKPLEIRMCPFIDTLDRPVASTATWVLPKLVGEVRFMDWTSTGHLRHPSWRGIRRDKLPGDL